MHYGLYSEGCMTGWDGIIKRNYPIQFHLELATVCRYCWNVLMFGTVVIRISLKHSYRTLLQRHHWIPCRVSPVITALVRPVV